jgi:hypothetical protein
MTPESLPIRAIARSFGSRHAAPPIPSRIFWPSTAQKGHLVYSSEGQYPSMGHPAFIFLTPSPWSANGFGFAEELENRFRPGESGFVARGVLSFGSFVAVENLEHARTPEWRAPCSSGNASEHQLRIARRAARVYVRSSSERGRRFVPSNSTRDRNGKFVRVTRTTNTRPKVRSFVPRKVRSIMSNLSESFVRSLSLKVRSEPRVLVQNSRRAASITSYNRPSEIMA